MPTGWTMYESRLALPAALPWGGEPLPPLPPALRNVVSPNRLPPGSGLLRAGDDREAILAWLATVSTSPHTQASYLKEADRLYRWAVLARGVPLSALTHEDLLAYRQFLANPQPAAQWVSPRRVARSDPAWRPFSGPLQPSSIRLALSVINALFSWLVEARYLAANPMVLSRQRRPAGERRLTRLLSPEQLQALWTYVGSLPTATPAQQETVSRLRWVLSLALLTGLRISELVNTRMAACYWLADRDGQVRWFVEVIGKGDKPRQVPLPAPVLATLQAYRLGLGLPALPQAGEPWPLLLKQRRLANGALDPRPLTRQALHQLIKSTLGGAAVWLQAQGQALAAAHLARASTHWLRHTAASRMGDAGLAPHAIMATLGHADLSTTSLYLHRGLEERHRDLAALAETIMPSVASPGPPPAVDNG